MDAALPIVKYLFLSTYSIILGLLIKLASKYSKALDIPNFKEVFEPIQTAVGARGHWA
jgi:hypothetical protein